MLYFWTDHCALWLIIEMHEGAKEMRLGATKIYGEKIKLECVGRKFIIKSPRVYLSEVPLLTTPIHTSLIPIHYINKLVSFLYFRFCLCSVLRARNQWKS